MAKTIVLFVCENKIKSGKNYQTFTSYRTKGKTKQKVRK